MKKLKPYLRWLILGATVFFLLKTLKNNWQEVTHVTLEAQGGVYLAIALLVTFLAHLWSGLVWGVILRTFQQPLPWLWALRVYLTTNIAKYLPGNIWHFYGRINAVVKAGGTTGVATITVLLEPLLMAAAALSIAIWSGTSTGVLQIAGLIVILVGIHPRFLNPLIRFLSRLKGSYTEVGLKSYPWWLLPGEWGFVLLRGAGFVLVMQAFTTVTPSQIPELLSVFSWAWLLGLIVPGAPGGLGVFEATAIAALNPQQFPSGLVLAVVAVFRLISILAEAIAALMAVVIGNIALRAKQK